MGDGIKSRLPFKIFSTLRKTRQAIWSKRILKTNEWVFGNIEDVVSLDPKIVLSTFDNQGNLHPLYIPSDKWRYGDATPWHEVGLNVVIECFGELAYSRVHKSLPPFFSKILEKPSIVQKKMIPHINGLGFSLI